MLIDTAACAQELSAATERIADTVGAFMLVNARAQARWWKEMFLFVQEEL